MIVASFIVNNIRVELLNSEHLFLTKLFWLQLSRLSIFPFSSIFILTQYSHDTKAHKAHTSEYKPQLWSCCLRSRDAVGRQQRWTAPMGTGVVTSGSPLAAPDLSSQTLCRHTEKKTKTQHFESWANIWMEKFSSDEYYIQRLKTHSLTLSHIM